MGVGRAIGMMDPQHKALSWVSAALFATGVFIISRGTLYELQWRGNFADTWYLYCGPMVDTWYLYCGPMVFICAIALLTLVKNTLYTRTICGLGLISRPSLGLYGFHALIIHALRTRGIELKYWPILEIIWIFCATLAASLLLSILVQRIDRNSLVS